MQKGTLKEILTIKGIKVDLDNYKEIEAKLKYLHREYPKDGFIILSLYQFYNEIIKIINDTPNLIKKMEILRKKGIESDTPDEIKGYIRKFLKSEYF
jgi:uncharacterized protein YhbP (UPF0306 family)